MGMTTDSATELQRDFKATIYWMKGNRARPDQAEQNDG